MPQDKKSFKTLFIVLAVLSFIASALFFLLLLSSVREHIIVLGEQYIGRPLTHEVWHERIRNHGIAHCILFFLYGIGFVFLPRVRFMAQGQKVPMWGYFKRLYASDKRFFATLIAVFCVISGVRWYWTLHKTGLHEDEIYTIGIVNRNEIGFWHCEDFDTNEFMTGKQIKQTVFFDDASIKDCLSDVLHLWVYTDDHPHPDLYYILLRLCFWGSGTYDLHTIILRGCALGFLFFCISFYFMCKTLSLLTISKIQFVLFLFLAFLNPASIGLSLFIRPYVMQEMSFVIFTYLFVCLYRYIQEQTPFTTKRNFVAGAIIIALTLLTQYFSLVYVGFLGLIILILLAKHKDGDTAFYFITMFLTALIFARLLYVDYGIGFIGSPDGMSVKTKLLRAIELTRYHVRHNFMPVSVIVLVGLAQAFMCMREKSKQCIPLLLIPVCLLWMLLVNYFGPIPNLRYSAPAFVLLSLCLVPCFGVQNKKVFIVSTIVQLCVLATIVFRVLPCNARYIAHLDDSDPASSHPQYTKDVTIPVFISSHAGFERIYPYLADEQIYCFVDSVDDIKNLSFDGDTYWFVTYEGGMSEILYRDGIPVAQ